MIKGLCHGCFSSNIEVAKLVNGMPLCIDCMVKERIDTVGVFSK